MTQGLVAPSDIADMAGVSRAAVSNWRASDRDFPDPAGGSEARPLFDVVEVAGWLVDNGYKIRTDRGERAIWALFNQYRGQWPIEVLAQVLIGVLAARKQNGSGVTSDLISENAEIAKAMELVKADPTRVADYLKLHKSLPPASLIGQPTDRGSAPGFDDASGRMFADLVLAVDLLDPADFEQLADDALARVAAAQARSAGEHGFVGSRVSKLLVNASKGRRPLHVYDPACGIGEVLVRYLAHLPKNGRVSGDDINENAVWIANQRLVLAGRPSELLVGDVLAGGLDGDLSADVVVVEPPFGQGWDPDKVLIDPRWAFGLPPKNSSELAWIQHAIHHLNADGHAYVITSGGALFRMGAERNIRSELVRRGCVEAIVGLPPKMLQHTSIPLFLWVLCRPGEVTDREHVLLIDAADEPEPENRVGEWLAGEPDTELPPYSRVNVRDLLGDDSNLLPQRWVGQKKVDAVAIAERYLAATRKVSRASEVFGPEVDMPTTVPSFATPRTATVKELANQGVVDIAMGKLGRDEIEGLEEPVVTPRVVHEGLPDLVDAAPLTVNMEPGVRRGMEPTRPGDVLVTTWNEIRAVVDPTGGRLLGNGVYRLRVDPNQINPDYLARCLAGDWNARHQMGTTIKKADARALEVPLIPLAEQAHVVHLLERIEHLRRAAESIAAATDDLRASLLDIVRYSVRTGDTNA